VTREVHGVTGKHKSNVDLHVAGGWCSCCFQGGIGTRAVNKSLLFKPSWGLLGAFSGLLGAFSGILGPSRGLLGAFSAFSGLIWPSPSPRRPKKAQEGLEKAPEVL
jgi:hypothetical protein